MRFEHGKKIHVTSILGLEAVLRITRSPSPRFHADACSSGDRKRRGRRDRRAQELKSSVQATLEQAVLLELMPRSELDIYVQVLQADGGEKAACINAAILAVANAGSFHTPLLGSSSCSTEPQC